MFKKGEVYLVNDGGGLLKEVEVLDVCDAAKAVRVDGLYGDRWMVAEELARRVVGKLGYVKYRGSGFFARRVVVKEDL